METRFPDMTMNLVRISAVQFQVERFNSTITAKDVISIILCKGSLTKGFINNFESEN